MKWTIIFTLFLLTQLSMAQSMEIEKLGAQIQEKFASTSGDFAIAFRDLKDPSVALSLNADDVFHAASTMKVPVMIEIFKQAANGKLSLADEIEVKNEFKSIVDGSPYAMDIDRDSGEGLYESIGSKRSVEQLVTDMIIYSSNLATNIVIALVDARNITKTMRDLGAKNIQVLRGVEDMKAFDKGLNNTTTANDLLRIFQALATGTLVSKEANEKMIRILLEQHDREVIPAHLPAEVRVAHKTGWITGIYHDAGIVYLPDGSKYILVLMSKKMEDTPKGIAMMADVSKMVYDFMAAKK